MSHNTFGRLFRFTTFGESHGPAIGCVIDGCPPGLEIDAAEILFHKGDPSDFMYVIISGSMDIVDSATDSKTGQNFGNPILINQLKTGDVVGELGFLRSVPRSATAITTEPVELLQINWKMIKRLQWLYPPTAHQFFFNLMQLICDRLDRLTQRFSEIKVLDQSS